MKLRIQKNVHSPAHEVWICEEERLRFLSPGEVFSLKIRQENGDWEHVSAQFVADRRSLLIGTEVYRFPSGRSLKNKNTYRFITEILRPVAPRSNAQVLGSCDVLSPMTGKVLSILVKEKSVVKEGDVLITIEAMKMENRILSERAGVIKSVRVAPSASVNTGDILLSFEHEN
jgi:biotin carboxyl carrier protein